jgi:hypothetical protein
MWPVQFCSREGQLNWNGVVVVARVKWADMRPIGFGSVRARPGTVENGPGLIRSTSRAMLRPNRQPVERTRHVPIRRWLCRHNT